MLFDGLLNLEQPKDSKKVWTVTPSGLRLKLTEPQAADFIKAGKTSMMRTNLKRLVDLDRVSDELKRVRATKLQWSDEVEQFGVTLKDVMSCMEERNSDQESINVQDFFKQ